MFKRSVYRISLAAVIAVSVVTATTGIIPVL